MHGNIQYEPQIGDMAILTKINVMNIFYIIERKDTLLRVNSQDNTIDFEIDKIYTPENMVNIYRDAYIKGSMDSAEYYVNKYGVK